MTDGDEDQIHGRHLWVNCAPAAFSSGSDLHRRRWQRVAKYIQLLLLHFLHHCLTVYAAILTLPPLKHCWDVKVAEDTDCVTLELLWGAAPGFFKLFFLNLLLNIICFMRVPPL